MLNFNLCIKKPKNLICASKICICDIRKILCGNECYKCMVSVSFDLSDLEENVYFNIRWLPKILHYQKYDISLHTLISLVFEEQIEVFALDYG